MLLDILPNVNHVFTLIAQQEEQFFTESVFVLKVLVATNIDASNSKRSHSIGSD